MARGMMMARQAMMARATALFLLRKGYIFHYFPVTTTPKSGEAPATQNPDPKNSKLPSSLFYLLFAASGDNIPIPTHHYPKPPETQNLIEEDNQHHKALPETMSKHPPETQRSSPSLFPFLFPVKSSKSSQQSDPNDLFRVQLLHRQAQSSQTAAATQARSSKLRLVGAKKKKKPPVLFPLPLHDYFLIFVDSPANHRKHPIHPSSSGHLLRSDLTGFMIFRRCSSSTTSDNGRN
uniref:Uncharacterized protein n=1 Tax=Solanum tuberosum TaxID=4113 RepID=M1DXS1_SOLTU